MNKEVEQRIVEMQFNNADFETKVQQSLETLHKLKDATKLEDAGKGLDNLAKSAKNVDLSSIAQGIEQLNQRFSAFGIVGMTVMQNLTNAAIGLGKQMVDALTEGPRGGMATYESFVSATKQLKNSAKDASGLPVTLEAVNKALDELNTYSDQTIYSFNDMTANIGKFTNAGVSLEDSVTAIKGISNVAASAGANAQNAASAMYNFGQALGTGVVKLIDWRSINNANMGTIEFKQTLIDTAEKLGTLKKMGDRWISTTYSGKKATEEAFNASSKFEDSLQQQWMTSEVLIKTLSRYADKNDDIGKKAYKAATEVNTFSQMMSVFAESQKTSWSKTWRYILGDYEESKELFTGILNGLNWLTSGFNEWRNNFFKSWHDMGGRSALVGSLSDIWETVQYYVTEITKALGIVMPDDETDGLTDKLFNPAPVVKVTEAIHGVTSAINPVLDKAKKVKGEVDETVESVQEVADHAEKLAELTQEIMQGKWGNGEERKKKLEEAGYAYENLQNAVNEAMGVEKRYETTVSDRVAVGLEDIEVTNDQANADKNATKSTEKRAGAIESIANILRAVGSAVKVVKTGAGALWNTVKKGAFLLDILKDGLKFILSVLGGFANKVTAFNNWILSFSSVEGFFVGLRRWLRQNKQEFEQMGVPIKNIQVLVAGIEKAFKYAKSSISTFFTNIRNGFSKIDLDKLYSSVMEIGKFVGGVLILAFEALAGVVTNVVDGFVVLYDKVKSMYVVQKLIGYFKSFKESISGTVESIKNATFYTDTLVPFLTEMAATFDRIGSKVGPVFVDIFEKFIEILGKINDKTVTAFAALQKNGVIDTATDVFNNFKDAIDDIPGAIAQFMDSFKTTGKAPELTTFPERIQNLVNSISAFFETLRTNATGWISKKIGEIGEFIKSLPTNTELGPFNTFVTTLGKAFDDFQGTVGNAKGTITDFADNVIGKISKIDFKGFAVTALIGSIALFALRWSKVGKSASFALKSIGKFILNGGKIATTAVDKYNGFLKIAAAIGIIAGSVWLLSTVPADRFAACVGVLVGAFAAMFTVIEALTLQKIPAENIKAIGIAFGGMGVALLAITVAAKLLAGMDPKEMAKGGTAIAVLTYMIVKAAKEAEKVGKGAGLAFLGLSLAVLMLIPSIKLLSGMDAHTLIKGGFAVFAFTQILARAAKAAGDASGAMGAFVGLSIALLVLIPSLKALAGMKTSQLIKGGIAVYTFLKMMTSAAKEAGDGGKGFLGMGIAIGIIAVSLKLMETIKWSSLMASTIALQKILTSLATAMSTVSQVPWKSMVKALLGMTACLVIVGGSLYLLGEYTNSDDNLKNALGMAAILWAFSQLGPSIQILSTIPFAAGAQAAANAMVFFGAMTLCLGALGEVAAWGDGKAGEAILNGATMIGRIMHNLVSAFVFDSDFDLGETLDKVGSALNGFGNKISGFLTALSETDISVVDKAKSLAMAIMALAGAELLEALTAWVSGKSSSNTFAEGLRAITGAIIELNTDLANVELDKKKFEQMTDIVKSMVDLANAMPKQGGLLSKFTGAKDLSKFADDMKEMVQGGLSSFVASVNILSISAGTVAKVVMISSVVGAMTKLANNLPESGVISWFVDGGHDLGTFATQMANFMNNGFIDFVNSTNSAPKVSLDKINGQIVPAAEAMITLGEKIQNKEGIFSFFSRKMDLGGFGETLKQFGTGISEFSTSIAGADPSHIDPITASMERLAALNASDDISSGNLGTFSVSINGLGGALKQFVTDTSGFDPESIGIMIDKLTSLHNLMLIMSGTDYSGVSGFAQALYELAKTGGEEFLAGFQEAASGAEEAVKTLVDTITSEIAGKADSFKDAAGACAMMYVMGFTTFFSVGFLLGAGKYLVDTVVKAIDEYKSQFKSKGQVAVLEFCSGINSNDGFLKGAGHHIVEKAIEGIKEYQDKFRKQGNYSADGYAKGISENAWKAADEAGKAAEAAKKKIAEINDSASPAKEYIKLAMYAMMGYALGFTRNTKMVTDAAGEAGYAGLDAMKEPINKMKALLDGDLDFQPTITPVWDMTNITAGVAQTNSMLDNLKVATTGVNAAIDIANAYNAELARRTSQKAVDYTKDLGELIANTRKIISATRENRYAIIDDGEMTKMVNYVDERFGMA